MSLTVDYSALAAELAPYLAEESLLSAQQVGALTGHSARAIQEVYAGSPGFPRPVTLTGREGRKSHPKWKKSEILDWISSINKGPAKAGRPRKT